MSISSISGRLITPLDWNPNPSTMKQSTCPQTMGGEYRNKVDVHRQWVENIETKYREHRDKVHVHRQWAENIETKYGEHRDKVHVHRQWAENIETKYMYTDNGVRVKLQNPPPQF